MANLLAFLTIWLDTTLHKSSFSLHKSLLPFLTNISKPLFVQGELLACPTMIKLCSTIIAFLKSLVKQVTSFFNKSFSIMRDSLQDELSILVHKELVELEPQDLSSIKSQLTPMLNVAFLS